MPRFPRVIRAGCAVLAAGLLCALLPGCASTEEAEKDPNQVSTIPWNRPERWESGGAMGSFMNTP